jgi:phosphoglycerate dehydrogenase-like enzyme
LAEGAEQGLQFGRIGRAVAEKVDVTGGTVIVPVPYEEEARAFEQKTVGGVRLAKPVQEALGAVTEHDVLVTFAAVA